MSGDQFAFCDLAVPGVKGLQPYQPGKPEAALRREYGVESIVKLASNESPLGPAPSAIKAIREAAAGVHRYPEGNAFELKERLARHHGVSTDRITLGNGSNDVLDLIARAFLGPGREAVFSRHAFAVYPIATRVVGGTGKTVPALPADHDQPYGHDLKAMATAIGEDTRVVFVANPNNPTGTWLTRAELEPFLQAVPANVIVVLDEAYVEYASEFEGYPDGTAWLNDYPNLIVTRTFSKAYGLCGVRVGYALSQPGVADLLNRVRHPFNVNTLAQVAATAALDDTAHIEAAVALNREERARVGGELGGLGLDVLPSAGNFLCVRVGDAAADVNEHLLREGVIVRPLAGYELPSFLRVSIGLREENDRFLQALKGAVEAGLVEVNS